MAGSAGSPENSDHEPTAPASAFCPLFRMAFVVDVASARHSLLLFPLRGGFSRSAGVSRRTPLGRRARSAVQLALTCCIT